MQNISLRFEAIGTRWQIEASSVSVLDVEALIMSRIDDFDRQYSRFRSDSLVTRIAQKAGTYPLAPDAYNMLSFYKNLYDITDGLVTPLVGQTISDAGYDASYSLQPKKHISKAPAWESVISFDHKQLHSTQPVLLDFGAAGKGYLIDVVSELLSEFGADSYTINAGGDIRYQPKDHTALAVALENPLDPREAVGIAGLTQGSICGSSGSRRSWGAYNHIINPKTLQSPRNIAATWVISETAMVADGLATALYFASPQLLKKQYNFSYAIVYHDRTVEADPEFPAEFFESSA